MHVLYMMATETTLLVSESSKNAVSILCTSLKRRFAYSRGAYIILLYIVLVFGVTLDGITNSPVVSKVLETRPSHSYMYYGWFLLPIVYPFIGLVGEIFNRFKVINTGVILIIVGKLCTCITALINFSKLFLNLFAHSTLCIGFGLCITNLIQSGLDQFLFESSDTMQSYIYFLFGLILLMYTTIYFYLIILTMFVEYSTLYWLTVAIPFTYSFLILIFLLLMCYCKKYIHIEPPPQVNPVKHIYKVMKYALLNKYPARRSAYTYTERPSRLDLCKERYGGPFTTIEVEDVKSFWHILLVLISMFGAYCIDTTGAIANYYFSNKLNYSADDSYKHASPDLILIVMYPDSISYGSIFLCILTFRLVYVPFLSRYLPRLLTRMGMGMFLALCTSCSLTLLSMWLNFDEESFRYELIIIAQVLYGCSYYLTLATTMEFIVAQSPLKMQGFLIGFWLCQFHCQYASYKLSLSLSKLNYLWQYHAAKTVIIFLSCLSFLVACSKYKYRTENELTDVNEYFIIAEYHERQILQSRDQD